MRSIPAIILTVAMMLPATVRLDLNGTADYITTIIAQIPVVALFAWVVLKMQANFDKTMARRDEQFMNTMQTMADRMDKLADAISQSTIEAAKEDRSSRRRGG